MPNFELSVSHTLNFSLQEHPVSASSDLELTQGVTRAFTQSISQVIQLGIEHVWDQYTNAANALAFTQIIAISKIITLVVAQTLSIEGD